MHAYSEREKENTENLAKNIYIALNWVRFNLM